MRILSVTLFLVVACLLVGYWATSDRSAAESERGGAAPEATTLSGQGAVPAPGAASLVEPEEPGGTQRTARAVESAVEAAPAAAVEADADTRTVLSGRVLDERGKPLANADVRAQRDSRDMLIVLGDGHVERALGKTRTGSDGRFRLELEASNALLLSVGADGYAPLAERTSAQAGQEKNLGDLELDRGVVLAGRVFDSAGAPVEGVEVFRPRTRRGGLQILGRVSGEVVATSDAEGRFRVARQRVGPWSLKFHSDDHPDGELEGITERPGEVLANLDVVLDDGFTIEGRVTGVPAEELVTGDLQGGQASLLVRAREPRQNQSMVMHIDMTSAGSATRERTATLAADGSFRLAGLTRDKEYALVLRRDTQNLFGTRARSDTVLAQAGERGVVIAYDAGSTLVFQVVDKASKAPLEEFTVRAGIQWPTELMESGRVAREHPEGNVRYGNLRPKEGETAQLEIEAVGYAKFKLGAIVLDANGDTDLGVLELAPVPVLRVHASDRSSGEPVAGARLTLTPPREGARSGRFGIRREISQEGDSISIPGQESERGETEADGWGTVTSLPGKTCSLTVSADGYAPFELESVELPAKGDHEVRVELGLGAEVRVTVVDTAGEPVAGARVEHQDPQGPSAGMLLGGGTQSERTDVHGVAHYTHLAPGSHAFRIDESNESGGAMFFAMSIPGEDAPLGSGWEAVAVEDGEAYELTLVAPGRGTLSGIIREDGAPLASASVSVREENGSGRSFGHLLGAGGPGARTDSQGRYEIDDLKPGDYTLSVTHSLRAMAYETTLRVDAGPNEHDADLPVSIVEGRVFDEHGEGLAGVAVSISRRESTQSVGSFMIAITDTGGDDATVFSGFTGGAARAETDEQGRYQLRGVEADTDLYIEARAQGYEPVTSKDFQVRLGELQTGVDVHLDKGGTIVVRVTGDEPDGLGLLARAKYLGPSAGGPELEEGEEVEPVLGVVVGGTSTLQGLRRGNWEVSLEAIGESEQELPEPKTVEVRPDEESLVAFEG